jgi:hypothetical protein
MNIIYYNIEKVNKFFLLIFIFDGTGFFALIFMFFTRFYTAFIFILVFNL